MYEITLTRLRRRVYKLIMTKSSNRNNDYWIQRLEKDGQSELLAQIQSGKISVYKATQLAGYRKKGLRSPAAILSYHWKRASIEERKRFIQHHLVEIHQVGRVVLAAVKVKEAKKSR